jgi:hypothetical protein
MSTRAFEMTFKVSRHGGRRLTWTRFYVPGVPDAVCHVAAIQAVRADYPLSQILTIRPLSLDGAP